MCHFQENQQWWVLLCPGKLQTSLSLLTAAYKHFLFKPGVHFLICSHFEQPQNKFFYVIKTNFCYKLIQNKAGFAFMKKKSRKKSLFCFWKKFPYLLNDPYISVYIYQSSKLAHLRATCSLSIYLSDTWWENYNL